MHRLERHLAGQSLQAITDRVDNFLLGKPALAIFHLAPEIRAHVEPPAIGALAEESQACFQPTERVAIDVRGLPGLRDLS